MPIANGTSFAEAIASASGGVPTSTTGSITTNASGSSFFIYFRGNGNPTAFTDNYSNVYTTVASVQNTSDVDWLAVYLCVNGSGGSGHKPIITTPFTIGCVLGLIEITGGAISSATDTSASAFDTSSPFGAAVTTSNANDMIIAFFGGNGVNTTINYVANGGFTLLSSASFTTGSSGLSCGVATRIVTLTGSYDPAFTADGGTIRGPVITIAIKQLAGSSSAKLLTMISNQAGF